ncbi:PaaI family thioesterase [Bacillus sp. Marseille-P3661]|uniref:PaaI family thioesterase n=1 Tax=Bacillus sp. Marseille-P3661 TaxID=1936234 RepID=UPI000C8292E6|nr:PaaI family thioesterase [Bacillus sp. Marseille-P3661]
MDNIHERVLALAEGPIWRMFGVHVNKGNDGVCELEFEVKKEFTQSYGSLHGGIIGTALDMAMGAAVTTTLDSNHYSNTIDLNVKYLRPMFGKRLIVKASIIKGGRRITVTGADAYNEEGKQIATANANFMILEK